MTEDRKRVEAILFTTGRFLKTEEIASLADVKDIEYLKSILSELKDDYDKRDSSLEIINEKSRWKLNIKKDYLHLTEKLLTDSELDRPTQETLAIIAYRNPAVQSDVIDMRGNKAYDHIKILKDNGFILAEKFGRTRLLKLTPKFYDYFDVVEENLKEVLKPKENG